MQGGDPAIWSSIKLVPFEVSFEGREDRGLKAAMKQELPGVLAWAVEGCLRWQEEGLGFPEAVTQATAAWRSESDQVSHFLAECTVRGEYLCARARQLYAAYRGWAQEVGEQAMAEQLFSPRVVAQGIQKKHGADGNWYLGVGLKAEGA